MNRIYITWIVGLSMTGNGVEDVRFHCKLHYVYSTWSEYHLVFLKCNWQITHNTLKTKHKICKEMNIHWRSEINESVIDI